MSEMRNDASLRGKVRHLANEHGLKPQEVLQMYLFEHLLMRLARSPYADRFVLKGGLLIYDLYAIPRYYSGVIDEHDLREALIHTAEKRGSLEAVTNWREVLEGIKDSSVMQQVWDSYVADTPYANDVAFGDTLDSIEKLMLSANLSAAYWEEHS